MRALAQASVAYGWRNGSVRLLVLAGLLQSPAILAMGYFLHGLWDLVHHPRYLRSPGPWWYKPLCLAYDWVIALVIVIRF